jgi:hypothetical protein
MVAVVRTGGKMCWETCQYSVLDVVGETIHVLFQTCRTMRMRRKEME